MANQNGHGGARPGAGRTKGSRNRLSAEMADRLLSEGKNPIDAMVRIAEKAEAEGDLALALSSWKAVATYVYPRPKPVETDPEFAIELAQATASARRPGEETGQGRYACSATLIDEWFDDMMNLADAAMDFGLAEKRGLPEFHRPKPSTLYAFDSEEKAAQADEEWARRQETRDERRQQRQREDLAHKAAADAGGAARDMLDMNVTQKTPSRLEQRKTGAGANGLGGFDTGEAA